MRIGRIDEQLVVNPTLPALQESTLDLIVVGTKDGLTMIEAGAQEIPEDVLLEAFELAHREIIRLCEAQEDLRSQIGKPKYLDPEVTQELEQQVGDRIRQRIQEAGLREGRRRRGADDELSPSLSMDSARRTSSAARRSSRASRRSSTRSASSRWSDLCSSSSATTSAR